MRSCLVMLLALGCAQKRTPAGSEASTAPVHIRWLEGAGYGWDYFNHRLSFLSFQVTDDAVWASAVGGTSTTGVRPEHAASCDPSSCEEFPFIDQAHVRVNFGETTTRRAVAGRSSVTLQVGSGGGVASATIPLSATAPPGSTALAVLSGFTLDTDVALPSGSSCYNPRYGWLPRRLELRIEDTRLSADRLAVELDVYALFEGGNTLEDVRACLDAVSAEGELRVVVDILALATTAERAELAITQSAGWEHGSQLEPIPQDPPTAAALDSTMADPMLAWSALSYGFHAEDADTRGAYLRTLDFWANATNADGTATNYSPGTQLSGFDFQFEGTLHAVDLENVTHEERTATLPVELDPDGRPVLHPL
jgi:hypothetical protein